MTIGGRIVTWPTGHQADIEQAKVFRALLATQRAELCDYLDEQAAKIARYEANRDSEGARRKTRQIKQIGADIRDIDRMMHALSDRLLGPPQGPRAT